MEEKKTRQPKLSPELVRKARGGDRSAVSDLYEQSNTELYRTICSMVRDEDLAWDILQDTYLRAFKSLPELRNDDAFLPWLRRIAVNASYSLTDCPFTDVQKGSCYYDAVMWGLENGITTGVTKTLFGVKKPCTGEQVMTFLYKMEGSPSREYFESYNGNPFTDVIRGKYYYPAIMYAHHNYLAAGVSSTLFGVGRPCTRAQIVTFLYAFFG